MASDKKADPFMVDEDTAPLTEDEIKKLRPAAALFKEKKRALPERRRGRPEAENLKQQVNIRLDADLLSRLRSRGKGWQTEVNQKLRELFMDEREDSRSA